MKHFYLPITAASPLSIRSDHAQEGAATAYAIPGATVLGSLAAAHRILRPENDEEFAQLFLNEQISMPYLYPARFSPDPSKSNPFNESNLPVIPLPKTAQTCKRFSGFKPLPDENTDEERHGIRDSLFDWAVFSLLRNEHHPIPALLAALDTHKECKQCKQVMDRIIGYYRCDRFDPKNKLDPKKRMKAQIATHLQTRTGINRSWGVVEEGILYNREVFDEGMRFWGEIILSDELTDAFMQFLDEAVKEDVIRIGTGRTRGLGHVTLTQPKKSKESSGPGIIPRQSRVTVITPEDAKGPLLPEAKREDLASFEQRLQRFNAALREQAQRANVKTLHDFYFAITLHSPTILCDAFLRYCTTLDAATLAPELDEPASTFELLYQSTEMQRITGWNELWGTPRPHDYALAMGSTFLFACTRPLDGKLLQALYTLEETGLGRRRTEGFGRICISDPFHLEGEQI